MRKLSVICFMVVMAVNQVSATSMIITSITEAEASAMISSNPQPASGVVRAGGDGADEMRLYGTSTDIVDDWDTVGGWVNNVNYGFQIAYDTSVSTLSMTITGDGFSRTTSVGVGDWFNTLVISIENNSSLFDNNIDGTTFDSLSAPDYDTAGWDGISITFTGNNAGNMEDFNYSGTFMKDNGYIPTGVDDWNIGVNLLQVPQATNTPPVAPTISNITVNSSMVNIAWSVTGMLRARLILPPPTGRKSPVRL